MLSEFKGKYGIRAKVLAYSISQAGNKLVTFEIEYPRMILAELNTHRMLSRNSASSRAIPFEKMQQQLTARPVRFGQANAGMQDKGEDFNELVASTYIYECDPQGQVCGITSCMSNLPPNLAWNKARDFAVLMSKAFYDAGYHKQVYNRLTEPFQMMKTVLSGTDLANFFWLRDDDSADPTIAELARVMKKALENSDPQLLYQGEWHLPYVEHYRDEDGKLHYYIETDAGREYLNLEDAIKVSSARSAAVSFRNTEYGVEKSKQVYERLVGDQRKHGSAMEHQATPMAPERCGDMFINCSEWPQTWEPGVSHMDRQGKLWSGNFCGWVQHRKLISGENIPGFMTAV